ncbi:Uncharacterised protein [Klebsiella variicola]|nr:Uncharacterised protein [Klebsiella variicola]
MMSLIKNHQIPPRSIQQAFNTRRTFECIDARNQSIVLGKCIGFTVSYVALRTEHFKIEVEYLVQLPVPVIH